MGPDRFGVELTAISGHVSREVLQGRFAREVARHRLQQPPHPDRVVPDAGCELDVGGTQVVHVGPVEGHRVRR